MWAREGLAGALEYGNELSGDGTAIESSQAQQRAGRPQGQRDECAEEQKDEAAARARDAAGTGGDERRPRERGAYGLGRRAGRRKLGGMGCRACDGVRRYCDGRPAAAIGACGDAMG
jgi:hypothetical protein